jgi:hypothetical protein
MSPRGPNVYMGPRPRLQLLESRFAVFAISLNIVSPTQQAYPLATE